MCFEICRAQEEGISVASTLASRFTHFNFSVRISLFFVAAAVNYKLFKWLIGTCGCLTAANTHRPSRLPFSGLRQVIKCRPSFKMLPFLLCVMLPAGLHFGASHLKHPRHLFASFSPKRHLLFKALFVVVAKVVFALNTQVALGPALFMCIDNWVRCKVGYSFFSHLALTDAGGITLFMLFRQA